jgi:hypothetical protein
MDAALVSGVIKNLRTMIELSNLEKEAPWQEWIQATVRPRDVRCWEQMQCNKTDCPAYRSECGRCWLIAGTLCACPVTGVNAQNIESCLTCKVFTSAIAADEAVELQELLIILVYSLRQNRLRLEETRKEVRLLEGLLPICAACKKIRDGEQNWQPLESYIRDHSMAEFSHGLCPDCLPLYYQPASPAPKDGA